MSTAVLTYDLPEPFLRRRRAGPTSSPVGPTSTRIPRATRALLQAHTIQRLLDEEPTRNLATLATAIGISRARVTQLLDLLLLAPDIQEEILFLEVPPTGREVVTEHRLRALVRVPDWDAQRRLWTDARPRP
jgi:hypothetical protein